MHRRIYVNPLPDCFNTRWAVHSGVALPRDVIDEVLDKELDAEEARRTAGHPQDVKSGMTLTAHEAGSPTTLPGQSTSGAKWAEPNSNYRTTVKILDRHQVEKGAATALLGLRDREDKQQLEDLLRELRSRSERRALLGLPELWRAQLDALEHRFPNFSEFVEHVRHAFAVAEAEDGVLRLDPMLLQGSPGVGKSFFCEEFARLLGSTLTRC